jgi:hypothetical protein
MSPPPLSQDKGLALPVIREGILKVIPISPLSQILSQEIARVFFYSQSYN